MDDVCGYDASGRGANDDVVAPMLRSVLFACGRIMDEAAEGDAATNEPSEEEEEANDLEALR